jgi:hypothetical protein
MRELLEQMESNYKVRQQCIAPVWQKRPIVQQTALHCSGMVIACFLTAPQ